MDGSKIFRDNAAPTLPENHDDARSLEEASSTAWQNPRSARQIQPGRFWEEDQREYWQPMPRLIGRESRADRAQSVGRHLFEYGLYPFEKHSSDIPALCGHARRGTFRRTGPQGYHVDFAAAMARMRRIRARIGRRISAERLSALGIDVYLGAARFTGPNTVAVDGTKLRFEKRSLRRDRGR